MTSKSREYSHKRTHLERQKLRQGRAATISARHARQRSSKRQKRISASQVCPKAHLPHASNGTISPECRTQSPRPNHHFLRGWIYPSVVQD